MKISTNFVRPAQRATLSLVAAFWAMSIAFIAGAWWLIDDASDARGELPDLRQRLVKMGTRTVGFQPQQMPSAEELARTRERVAKINAAAQTKGAPTLSVLAELEAQLPPQAWLVSFHHRAAVGEVQLVVAAAKADTLASFLLALERDPLFAEAMLVRELQTSGDGRAGAQYEIRLKVRS